MHLLLKFQGLWHARTREDLHALSRHCRENWASKPDTSQSRHCLVGFGRTLNVYEHVLPDCFVQRQRDCDSCVRLLVSAESTGLKRMA